MKEHNIEELFEAAKRHNKDIQRQQRLSNLIDHRAAEEIATAKSNSRKRLWITVSVAASILLLVTIVIHALLPNTDLHDGTVLATKITDTNTDYISVRGNTPSEDLTLPDRARPLVKKEIPEIILTAENTTNDINEPSDTTTKAPTESLLLVNNTPEHENEMTTTEEIRIYERTSNRLVGSNTQQLHITRAATRPSTNDIERPLIAYSGSGTNVLYDLAKFNFQ